jgi:hypothetical protein
MQIPLQITFRRLGRLPEVESRIQRHIERLQRRPIAIDECRVGVERLPHAAHHGNHYHVRIEAAMPDGGLLATPACSGRGHTDIHAAVAIAFGALERLLDQRDERHPAVAEAEHLAD